MRAEHLALALALGALLACPPPLTATPCADNSACPAGQRCDPARHYCYAANPAPLDGGPRDRAGDDGARTDRAATTDGAAGSDQAVPADARVDAAAADQASPDTTPADSAATDQASTTTVAAVFRSVGPGQTQPIAAGTQANSVAVAVDSVEVLLDLPARAGVGDVLVYDSDGDGIRDALVFLVERVTARSFLVQPALEHDVVPTLAPTPHWALFRAYTSLAQAVVFAENAGIDAALRDFDPFGAPPDLVARDLSWNIACYGDAADVGTVEIQGWTTDSAHWLRLYTPTAPEEVGVSQRHWGQWTESGAYLLRQACSDELLRIDNPFVSVDGLQLDLPFASGFSAGVSVLGLDAGERGAVRHCIVRGGAASTGNEYLGIELWQSDPTGELHVSNNLVYGLGGSARDRCALCVYEGTLVAIHNTLAASTYALDLVLRDGTADGRILAINNLITGCDVAGRGQFLDGTGHNATDLPDLGYTVTSGGAGDRVAQSFAFVDVSGANFHLTDDDTGARDRGADTTDLGVVDDLDGQPRSGPRDIGADEFVP